MNSKKILFVNLDGYKPLPHPSVLKVASADLEFLSVSDIHSATTVLESSKNICLMVSNAPKSELFNLFCRNQKSRAILVTDKNMENYSSELSGKEFDYIDHVIANRSPSEWTLNELRVTLQKMIKDNIFGISQYLKPNVDIQKRTIKGSKNRTEHNQAVSDFAQDNRLGLHVAKIVYSISEELIMNAVYDAPLAAGREEYSRENGQDVVFAEPDFAYLEYAFDGQIFAISVKDLFGSIERDKYFKYLKKVLIRHNKAKLIDTKKGGAGLGLYKILYFSHAIVCNLDPTTKTEITALLDMNFHIRDFAKMPKSIHFFSKKNSL